MRQHLLCVAVLTWLVPAALHGADPAPPALPNIVFILADDLGINDLACYGRTEHRTPNLDRLAAEGTRLTSAYCALPICSASRAAILSGKNPARLHLTTFLPGRPDCSSQRLLHPVIRQQLPLEEQTLAEYLRDAGYATACIGKWHLGGAGFGPREQGFDLYHPGKAVTTPSDTEGGKGEYDLTAQAEQFIEANRDRPFFVYLAHNTPHIPYSAKERLVATNQGTFEPVYAAVIETLDDSVGQLLQRLDTLGLASNTIVIFTSDNGGLHVPELNHRRITHNAPYRAGKGYLQEGGLRIPSIVRWTGHVPAGRVIDAPVINTDWLPTLLECAGRPVPSGLDGVSLGGLLTGHGDAPQRVFCWHFPHYANQGSQPSGAVREGDWKLIEYYEDERVELFNLAEDIAETTNLAASAPQRVDRMRAHLAAWRKDMGAQTNAPNPTLDADYHRVLYEDIDVSHFNPATADEATWQRMYEWRKQMDAAVRRD
jgi:arylsulfatase A-like enzyme